MVSMRVDTASVSTARVETGESGVGGSDHSKESQDGVHPVPACFDHEGCKGFFWDELNKPEPGSFHKETCLSRSFF